MSETPEFQHYPKMMVHPHFRPAKLGTSPDERKGTPGIMGSPIYMPPVTVNDERQEEYHASLGYVPGGNSNPAAFVAAHAAPDPEGYGVVHEYPKWVMDKEVHSEAEEAEYRAEWAQREEAARAAAERAAQEAVEPPADGSALAGTVAALAAQVAALANVVTALAARPPEAAELTRGQKAWATRQARAMVKATEAADPASGEQP